MVRSLLTMQSAKRSSLCLDFLVIRIVMETVTLLHLLHPKVVTKTPEAETRAVATLFLLPTILLMKKAPVAEGVVEEVEGAGAVATDRTTMMARYLVLQPTHATCSSLATLGLARQTTL